MLILFRSIPLVLMLTAPILITATGGMFCERSGIVNIALEGLMAIGALAAAAAHVFMESNMSLLSSLTISIIIAMLASMIFSALHGVCAINLNSDQTISGVGINLLADGVTIFVSQILFQADRTKEFRTGMKTDSLSIYPSAYISIIVLLLVWYVMYRVPYGLHLRACGEHPEAAESAGVNVRKVRWSAVLVSGALAGLAGACCVLTQSTQFTGNLINGKGYIALAAVAFGRWRPMGVFLASLLFGFAQTFALIATNLGFLSNVPSEVFSIIPYAVTLVALVIFSGKNYAPSATGKPFTVAGS